MKTCMLIAPVGGEGGGGGGLVTLVLVCAAMKGMVL